MPVKPILGALVLSDHIYIDGASGKKVIAGTFNHLTAREFPTQFSTTKFAFISLTDVHGTVPLVLRYVDLKTNATLLELADIEVASDDPLATVEVVVEVPRLPMPHEGAYAFEVHAGNELLGFVRLFVSRADFDDEAGDE